MSYQQILSEIVSNNNKSVSFEHSGNLSYDLMNQLFAVECNHNKGDDKDQIEEKDYLKMYFISNKPKDNPKETETGPTSHENKINHVKFKTTQKKDTNKKMIGKKKGRIPKNQITEKKGENKRKYKRDNILTKFQAHFISYLIIFLNSVLRALEIKEEFKKIDYDLKKSISYDYFTKLQGKTIKDVVSMKISPKYLNFGEKHNQNLCESIDNQVVKNILSKNYLDFFQNYYYKNVKEINLKDFGLEEDQKVILSHKGKKRELTYQDKLDCFQDDKLYIALCDKHVKENYDIKYFVTEKKHL